MKAPTLAGRRLLDKIEGLREYLTAAEEDDLRLRNPPRKTPQLFERCLPYAMALDVEELWGEKFTAVLETVRRGRRLVTAGFPALPRARVARPPRVA